MKSNVAARNAANAAVQALRERIQGIGRAMFSPVRLYPLGQYPHLDPKLTRCEWSHYGKGVKVHVAFTNNHGALPESRTFGHYGDTIEAAVEGVEGAIRNYLQDAQAPYAADLRKGAEHCRDRALADFEAAERLEAEAKALETPDAATVQAGEEERVKTLLEQFEELEEADSEVSAAGAYEIETPERRAEVITKQLRAKALRQGLRRALSRQGVGR